MYAEQQALKVYISLEDHLGSDFYVHIAHRGGQIRSRIRLGWSDLLEMLPDGVNGKKIVMSGESIDETGTSLQGKWKSPLNGRYSRIDNITSLDGTVLYDNPNKRFQEPYVDQSKRESEE